MNTEEVYRSLHKTTAEIQNYSFETKLGRDTNSKDSGISQMDDQQAASNAINEPIVSQMQQSQYFAKVQMNGFNGVASGDSYNNSNTQSATTTESNTPENTVRLDEINARNTFTARVSNNVTYLSSGELVTECKPFSFFH